ncbi:hypothetical protein C5470_19310 [Photorhabdus stackebrandtii]|uniref:Uncharacterized protein n=1 Tax=Photorhabdus stackebrandtii TaxID=1123042 RepID=A0A7X5QQA8_9GAMM|nr:hypothetical protein [Photorhabdus stackebrandtii]
MEGAGKPARYNDAKVGSRARWSWRIMIRMSFHFAVLSPEEQELEYWMVPNKITLREVWP